MTQAVRRAAYRSHPNGRRLRKRWARAINLIHHGLGAADNPAVAPCVVWLVLLDVLGVGDIRVLEGPTCRDIGSDSSLSSSPPRRWPIARRCGHSPGVSDGPYGRMKPSRFGRSWKACGISVHAALTGPMDTDTTQNRSSGWAS